MFSSKYNDLKPTMKKLLLALLILLATSALAQQQDVAPLQISTNDQTSQKPVLKRQPTLIDEQKSDILSTENLSSKTLREQLPSDVQKALLDIEKNEIDRRVEYLQHQQTIFFSIFSVAAAIAIFGIGYFLSKNLGEKYRNKEQEMESRMKLLESTTAHRITNLDMQVALSEKSVEETRHKIDKAVDEAVNKAIERVHKKTEEKTEAFSTLVEERMKDIQKAHNEINLTKDKATKDADEVSRLLKEIEESKGELTPKLQEEIKEQVEKTEKEKNESEYTAEDWFLKGTEAYEKNNYTTASEYYEKACKLYEQAGEKSIKSGDACNRWGLALLMDKKITQSLSKFEKANEIVPNNKNILANWSAALSLSEKYPEAILMAQKAINAESNSYTVAYNVYNRSLNQIKETEPELYTTALYEFKKLLQANKEIINQKGKNKFQKIYNEHFPTETSAEKPKTSPKKGKDDKKKK